MSPLEGRPESEVRGDLLVGARDEVPRDAAYCGCEGERGEQHQTGIDADEGGRRRILGDRAERQPEPGSIEQQVEREGDRRRADEHDEMVTADEERTRLEREVRERRKRIGAFGEDDGDDLLELHPHGEARDHGGERRSPPHCPEADTFHVEAGQHRSDQGGDGHDQEAGIEFDVQQGAREDPEHDRGAVGEV